MNDTKKLLKECDSGCKTAIDGMAQVISHIGSTELRSVITASSNRHATIGERCRTLLHQEGEQGGEPPAMAEAFMKMGTGFKLAVNDEDGHIAEMMADGANMGMKSIAKVMNACPEASPESRTIASELIREEQQFFNDMLKYL